MNFDIWHTNRSTFLGSLLKPATFKVVPPVATAVANLLTQICVKVYITTCKTVVSVFVALKRIVHAPDGLSRVSDFPQEARRYLIASILEENKHRGNATCANNCDGCPNGCYSKVSSLKHLFSAPSKGGQRRFMMRRRKPTFTDNVCVRSMS